MKVTRLGVFETNSSSTHSISIVGDRYHANGTTIREMFSALQEVGA